MISLIPRWRIHSKAAIISVLSIIGVLSAAATTRAAGLSVGDQGAVASGRAGAFVAKADDASAIEYNPAGLSQQKGTRIYIGNRFGYTQEQFRRAPLFDWSEAGNGVPGYVTFDTVQNEKPWQLLGPMLAATTDFGLKNWTFAIGTYAPSGIGSQRFPDDGGQRYMLTERDVKILYYNLSAAWKYSDRFGVGISLQWVDLAKMKLSLIVNGDTTPGVVSPVSSLFDMKATVEGADHKGISGIVGIWYRPVPSVQLGLSGRVIPTRLFVKGKLSLSPMELQLESDPELTRNGQPNNRVTFEMTLPVELRLGARYSHRRANAERFDIEIDFRYERWSQMDRYVINGSNLHTEVMGVDVEVGKIVIPKNWRDTFSIRAGGDINVLPHRLTLRTGAFFETAASQKQYAFVDFMASSRVGASAGASIMLGRFDLAFSYSYIFEIPFTVSERQGKVYQQVPGSYCESPYTDSDNCDARYLGQPAATANSGSYMGRYHFGSLALSYGF